MKYFGQWRRLAEDHEELPEVSEAMVTPAAIRMMRSASFPQTTTAWHLPGFQNGQ